MRTLPLALPLLLVAGCFPHEGVSGPAAPTPYFDDCGDGCTDKDWRFAAGGAHTTIAIHGTVTDVRSSRPDVVDVVINGANRVEAFTGVAGTAELELTGPRGDVTRQTVVVVDAARLTIQRQGDAADPVRVLEGAPQVFHVVTRDADGQITRGDGAVAFTLAGTLSQAFAPLDGDAIAFTGAPGQGRITATCPSASVTQDVTVVPTAAVTGLSAGTFPDPDGSVLVVVGAISPDGPVYAGACAWTGMDPSVTLASQTPASIDFAPASLSKFVLTRPGTYTVTCAMAGRTTDVLLAR